MTIETIATIAHEANRVYCESIGDFSQSVWENAPEWQKISARNGVCFHLNALRNGDQKSPIDSHESWLHEKEKAGWKYGPVKDADKKEHPCFLPYEKLPVEQKVKDYLFSGIVRSIYQSNIDIK